MTEMNKGRREKRGALEKERLSEGDTCNVVSGQAKATTKKKNKRSIMRGDTRERQRRYASKIQVGKGRRETKRQRARVIVSLSVRNVCVSTCVPCARVKPHRRYRGDKNISQQSGNAILLLRPFEAGKRAQQKTMSMRE